MSRSEDDARNPDELSRDRARLKRALEAAGVLPRGGRRAEELALALAGTLVAHARRVCEQKRLPVSLDEELAAGAVAELLGPLERDEFADGDELVVAADRCVQKLAARERRRREREALSELVADGALASPECFARLADDREQCEWLVWLFVEAIQRLRLRSETASAQWGRYVVSLKTLAPSGRARLLARVELSAVCRERLRAGLGDSLDRELLRWILAECEQPRRGTRAFGQMARAIRSYIRQLS